MKKFLHYGIGLFLALSFLTFNTDSFFAFGQEVSPAEPQTEEVTSPLEDVPVETPEPDPEETEQTKSEAIVQEESPSILLVAENSCTTPDSLDDDAAEEFGPSIGTEKTLQEVLDEKFPDDQIDVTVDQTQYQLWSVTEGEEITVTAAFIDEAAQNGNVFGYYTNGDLSTFTPLFRKGEVPGFDETEEAASGDSYEFVIPDDSITSIGFAIQTSDEGAAPIPIAAQNSLNANNKDQVVTYNPRPDNYILAFEDMVSNGDYDFNDLVVEIAFDCPDGGGTGGGDPECSDEADNDDDELIDAADPGCHSDGDADNPDSYVPTDDDETNEDGNGGGGGDTDPECSDEADNDGDELIDEADPGCHTDGNADDDDTYDPNDDDESDDDDNGNGGSGGSSGSSRRSGSRPNPPGEILGEEACGEYITSYIRWGSPNDTANVVRLQTFLNEYMNANLVVDGVYGPGSYQAVKQFQVREATNVLNPWKQVGPIDETGTGFVYKTTKRWINMIKCPELNIPEFPPSELVHPAPGAPFSQKEPFRR